MTAPKGTQTRYKTTNRATYNAALKAKWSLTIGHLATAPVVAMA